MKQLKVVINRAKWCVPPNTKVMRVKEKEWYSHEGYLLSPDGLMCCLGFVGRECKIPKKQLLGNGTPSQVFPEYQSKWPKNFLFKNEYDDNDCTPTINKLMGANDTVKLTNSRREARIISLGKKIGIKFSFIGKYLKPKA